jgi:O-antigen ligase
MISIIVFLISTSWVVGKDVVIDQDISEDLKFAITNRYSTINDNQYEKEILQLSLFYFRDNRIFSTDGNLNWRFQIWQDVYQDLNKDNKFLTGYGFHSAIPAMDNDQRYGQDQLNIQVHNYLVHILSRGGLLHLITICFIYYLLYVIFKSRNLEINYLMLVTPLLFNSLFDPSMENAHYSVILFAVIGLIYNHNRIFKKDIKI